MLAIVLSEVETVAPGTAQVSGKSIGEKKQVRDLITPYSKASANLYPQAVDFMDRCLSVSTLTREHSADVPSGRVSANVRGSTGIASIVAAIVTQNRGTHLQSV